MFLNKGKKKKKDFYCGFIKKPANTTYVALVIRKSKEKSEKDTLYPGEKKIRV